MPARACLLLLATCAHAHMVGKEFVCEDPDTGTLHGINTTWRSISFCGNYTCKIRQIDTTQATPKIMVNLFHPEGKTPEPNNENNHTNDIGFTKYLPELSKDNDRLLNKAEINKIIELLHTVKKSDFEAVIELYNVAQEFYKDMKVPDAKIHNSEKLFQSRNNEDFAEKIVNKMSYWYEPLSGHKKVVDMKTEGSENKEKIIYPYRRPYLQPYFYSQSNLNYPSYFNGPVLNNGDVGRLEYYNSQVNQRSLPYYSQQTTTTTIPQSSCNPCPVTYQHQSPIPANYQQRVNNMHPYPSPFYKFTRGYNNNFKGNPWTYYEHYKGFLYPYQYQTTPQIQQNSETPKTEDATEKKVAVDEYKVSTEKDDSWKTDPLSDDIIQEIRANVAQRSKLLSIPFKKRIKLERAAKVIKLDQFTRKTRSIRNKAISVDKNMEKKVVSQEENEKDRSSHENKNFEVYVEKVTCEPPSELGYFKIGNMTRPFPDCCPQKIEDKL